MEWNLRVLSSGSGVFHNSLISSSVKASIQEDQQLPESTFIIFIGVEKMLLKVLNVFVMCGFSIRFVTVLNETFPKIISKYSC